MMYCTFMLCIEWKEYNWVGICYVVWCKEGIMYMIEKQANPLDMNVHESE